MMRIIRDEIGFDNLIMTDDISMEALSGSIADRSRAALDAGCDLVLHCNGDLAQMESVAEIGGSMSAAAEPRAARALAARTSLQDIDIRAAEEEFRALISG